MKRCEKCNCNVATYKKTCPLCGEVLTDIDNNLADAMSYPQYKVAVKSRNMVLRVFLFLSITSILVTCVINYYTYSTDHIIWCGYVLAAICYGWVLVRHTIMSKRNFGSRMVIETLSLSAFVIVIDILSGMPDELRLTWSIDYCIPFITIASTLIILFILVIKKIKYKDYLIHLMTSIILGFVPLILYLVGVVDVFWPSLAAGGLSLLTILGIIIFADKETRREIKKRFHI